MTEIEKTFFELIRVSLGNAICLSHSPSADEWGKLYAMAKKQSLVGICFAGVQKLQAQYQAPFEKLFLQWMGMAAKIQQRNEIVNKQCVELQERLAVDGFKSCILKGQGVAQLYDESLRMLRQSGDIDVWCSTNEGITDFYKHRDNIIDFVMCELPTKEFDDKHIHYDIFTDTAVELHYVPSVSSSNKVAKCLNEYFQEQQSLQLRFATERKLNFPTLEFQLVHQLLHSYGHFIYEGIGLRQLMDLYFSVVRYVDSEDYDQNRIIGVVERLGLSKFLSAALWVLVNQFGLDECHVIRVTDKNFGKELLDDVLMGGNFGSHNEKQQESKESFLSLVYMRIKRQIRLFRYDTSYMINIPSFLIQRIKIYTWIRRTKKRYSV